MTIYSWKLFEIFHLVFEIWIRALWTCELWAYNLTRKMHLPEAWLAGKSFRSLLLPVRIYRRNSGMVIHE